MTLFWNPTGPLVTYQNGILYVADLNPETTTKWAMSRWEMFKLGLACLGAAVRG